MGGVVPDVAVDSEDRVYVTRRDPPAILVYDREGRYLTSFGESVLSNLHNTWIDPADHLYCADIDDHTVRIFDVEGRFLEAWTDVESPNDIHIDENGIVYVAEAPSTRQSVRPRWPASCPLGRRRRRTGSIRRPPARHLRRLTR